MYVYKHKYTFFFRTYIQRGKYTSGRARVSKLNLSVFSHHFVHTSSI